MKGHALFSHGLDSGPHASKISALANVADSLGLRTTRPDYRDLDITRDVKRIDERIARLKAHIVPEEPLILVGSSMGAFISGLASLECVCLGLFLIAPPMRIPEYEREFSAATVPTVVVHGWQDELIPADEVIDFAKRRQNTLIVVDDSHRLTKHVNFIAEQFREFITKLS